MKDIVFSTDKNKLNLNLITNFLHNYSYWAKDRSIETINKSIENSFCIGVYIDNNQIGFARIVTDFATVYYLADIFIISEYQNMGIGHKLMSYIGDIKELEGLRGILTTQTAHKFYEEFGFTRDNDIVQRRIMVK